MTIYPALSLCHNTTQLHLHQTAVSRFAHCQVNQMRFGQLLKFNLWGQKRRKEKQNCGATNGYLKNISSQDLFGHVTSHPGQPEVIPQLAIWQGAVSPIMPIIPTRPPLFHKEQSQPPSCANIFILCHLARLHVLTHHRQPEVAGTMRRSGGKTENNSTKQSTSPTLQ